MKGERTQERTLPLSLTDVTYLYIPDRVTRIEMKIMITGTLFILSAHVLLYTSNSLAFVTQSNPKSDLMKRRVSARSLR